MGSCCILLAAGPSRRFGSQKLLVEVGGRRLIDLSLRPLLEGGCGKVVIVTGLDLGGVPEGVRLVNPGPVGEDMVKSVKAGIAACGDSDVYVIQLGDMPLVPPEFISRLIKVMETGLFAYAQPMDMGRRKKGHPVAISRSLALEVLESPEGTTLRDVLKAHEGEGIIIPAGPWCTFDVDTEEDLRVLKDLLNIG